MGGVEGHRGLRFWEMPFDGAFSPLHWLIVGVVALLVLGPDQLPKLARSLGSAKSEFEKGLRESSEDDPKSGESPES